MDEVAGQCRSAIDGRSICDIAGDELRGFRQVHLFAGIAGWNLALHIAQWPDDVPVWTGSCPCQPFSIAGKMRGQSDRRHLWPEMFRLVRECRPPVVFGEQVASKLGRSWLAGVFDDLESIGYRCAGADLCAASVGAPHKRQRLFWVADTNSPRWVERIKAATSDGHRNTAVADGGPGVVGHAIGDGWQGVLSAWSSPWGVSRTRTIEFIDGKRRRIESGIIPLVDGVPSRVAQLRGLGNSIVPQVAAVFVRSYMESV